MAESRQERSFSTLRWELTIIEYTLGTFDIPIAPLALDVSGATLYSLFEMSSPLPGWVWCCASFLRAAIEAVSDGCNGLSPRLLSDLLMVSLWTRG